MIKNFKEALTYALMNYKDSNLARCYIKSLIILYLNTEDPQCIFKRLLNCDINVLHEALEKIQEIYYEFAWI